MADTVDVPIGEEADLSLVKTGAPKPARPGELVTYTLAAANAGPSSAVNAWCWKIRSLRFLNNLEWSLDNGAAGSPGRLPPLGTLLPGEARVILLRGYGSRLGRSSDPNTAAVTSDTPDPDPGNNTSSEAIPIEQSADLSVTKTGSPSPVSAGGVLTYTVELSNLGPSDAQNTVLSDPLPDMLSGGSYSLTGSRSSPGRESWRWARSPPVPSGQYSCGAQRIRRPQVRCATQPPFPVIHPIRTRTTTLSPNAPRSIPPLT